MEIKKDFFYGIIITTILVAFFISFINPIGFITVDEVEHLRSSFLIFQGKVPFLDFFQHHHLLLGYLFSPVFLFVYRDPIIFIIARFVIYLVLLSCIYYGVGILDCLKTDIRKNRIIFPFIFLLFAIQNGTIFNFRHDTLMILFFLMGIYYFFRFLDVNKIKQLSISFLCFTLSFFALQKIIIAYPVILFVCIYLIVRKKLLIKDAFIAALPSIIIASSYLAYLLLTGSFEAYFACCFTVNKLLTQTLTHPFKFPLEKAFAPIYLIIFFIPYLLWKYRNIQMIMLTAFFTIFFIQACFLNPWPQYQIPLITVSSLILCVLFCKETISDDKRKLYSSLTIFLSLSIMTFHYLQVKKSIDTFMNNYRKLLTIITETDTVADEFRDFNIWNPTTAWHEFFLVQNIDYEKLGLPKKDANETIRKNKPDIIHAGGGPLLSDLLPEYDRIPKKDIGFPWALYKKKKK